MNGVIGDGAAALPRDFDSFLRRSGQIGAHLVPYVGDASPRRYFRVVDRALLLMEDRTDAMGFAAYLRLSEHLLRLGLSAPRVVAADPGKGLALVEDFGDATYAACLRAGASEADLYRLAVEVLLHLHHAPDAIRVFAPAYDLDVHLDELSIFSHWFAPSVRPGLDVAGFDTAFRALWRPALVPVAERLDTLVLRDFHVDNLMLLQGRQGVARCGLLDFQDGVIGACEYDLVSLLQDARRDLAPGLEDNLLAEYAARAPSRLGGVAAIRHRYAVLGAQRHCRILGVFVRLCQRDAKPRYLGYLPRVMRQFRMAMEAARLTAIRAFLDAELPGWADHADRLASLPPDPK